jgi:hypothetical protein
MKTSIKILALSLCLTTLFSCKQEPKLTYQFSDNAMVVSCENVQDKALLNEAFYSFEKDLAAHYLKNNTNQQIDRAYASFISRNAGRDLDIIPEMISHHTFDVYKELRKTDVFDANGKLNPNSTFIACVGNSILDPQIKTTFNALKSTNSLKGNLIAASASSLGLRSYRDNTLRAYIALALYYDKMATVDESKLPIHNKPKEENTPTTGPVVPPSSGGGNTK